MTSLSEKTINNALTRSNSAEIARFGMPARGFSVLTAQDAKEYTAPSNGFYFFSCSSSSKLNMACHISVNNQSYYFMSAEANYLRGAFILPIRKGDTFKLYFQSNVGFDILAFYPADGG